MNREIKFRAKIIFIISLMISSLSMNSQDYIIIGDTIKSIVDGNYLLNYTDTVSTIFYSDYIYISKDTFIEIEPNIWYNEFSWQTIDSTKWYNNIDQFVKLFEQYELKCYNDSIKYCRYHRIQDEQNFLNSWTEFTCIWIHQIPTFSGFKDFLKSKLLKQ